MASLTAVILYYHRNSFKVTNSVQDASFNYIYLGDWFHFVRLYVYNMKFRQPTYNPELQKLA